VPLGKQLYGTPTRLKATGGDGGFGSGVIVICTEAVLSLVKTAVPFGIIMPMFLSVEVTEAVP
jgi:hypothetical protein